MQKTDSVWKELIYKYFEEFLNFFFPHIHKDIDFTKRYEFLDKELEKIVPDSSIKKRYADVLVKVVLKNGKETWLLVHIEVQGYYEKEFAKRMYSYNYRIFDRYEKDVVSVAILTDSSKDYRPDIFERNYWDFKLLFKFPIVKIIDYKDKEEELQKDKNPFSIVVLTHLKEQETKDNIDQRKF